MEKFFRLIQISISPDCSPELNATEEEWGELFSTARKQTLLGILFAGVMRLPDNQKPPKQILLQWFAIAEKIKQYNRQLNRNAAFVCQRFKEDGFRAVILKGQGNARFYPDPLLRQPGDIDVWVEGSRRELINYIRRFCTIDEIVYHHADFPVLKDAEVEVHFTPSWMYSFITNHRLQQYFRKEADRMFSHEVVLPDGGSICVPPADVNRIYLLVHIYRHLFDEGIGLRQLLDYYFLLRQGCTEEEKRETRKTLRRLGMLNFAASVMYVMKEVFALPDEYLLMPPDEKNGRFLLNEILEAGNFGTYDTRNMRRGGESLMVRFMRRCSRNARFLSSYPSEALWAPLFKVWHHCWRWRNGYLHALPQKPD